MFFFFFFFNDTATTEIYTLSLHDALPIYRRVARYGLESRQLGRHGVDADRKFGEPEAARPDRKSTRLNSSHSQISYAVFCLKKKKKKSKTKRHIDIEITDRRQIHLIVSLG